MGELPCISLSDHRLLVSRWILLSHFLWHRNPVSDPGGQQSLGSSDSDGGQGDIFIFLPIIALAVSLTLAYLEPEALLKSPDNRRALAMISLLTILMILAVFFMGALISNAGRAGGLA